MANSKVVDLAKTVIQVWEKMGGGLGVSNLQQVDDIIDMTTQRFPMYGVAGYVELWEELQEEHGLNQAFNLLNDELVSNHLSLQGE